MILLMLCVSAANETAAAVAAAAHTRKFVEHFLKVIVANEKA